MSEFKRQIAAGATVAVIVTFVLALGLATLFPGATANQSSTTAAATSGATTSSRSTPATSATSSSSISSAPSSTASSSAAGSSTALTASGATTLQTTSSSSPISSSSSSAPSSSTGTASTATTITSSSTTTAVVTSSTTNTLVTSGTVSSATTSESSTGCYSCGVLKIGSANLTVGAAGNVAVLSLTIFNNGSESVTNISVSLDSTAAVVVPALAAGAQTVVSIQVPGTQSVQVGQSYEVSIQGGYQGYLVGATASVQASS